MTEFTVIRQGKTVCTTIGELSRTIECLAVQQAVALHGKLASDRAFAERWAMSGDQKMPDMKPHYLERPF